MRETNRDNYDYGNITEIFKEAHVIPLHTECRSEKAARTALQHIQRYSETPKQDQLIIYTSDGYISAYDQIKIRLNAKRNGWKYILLYSEADVPLPALNGWFPSLSKRYQSQIFSEVKSSHYWTTYHPQPTKDEISKDRLLLASFVGKTSSHKVRSVIASTLNNKSGIYVIDTENLKSHQDNRWSCSQDERCSYCQILQQTRFSICPRGYGPNTFRLFESLAWGCVPVIISDDYAKRPDLDWDSFSITIKERDAGSLMEILNQNSHRVSEMSTLARQTWERHFNSDNLGDMLLKSFSQDECQINTKQFLQRLTYALLSEPYHSRSLIKSSLKAITGSRR